MDDELPGFKINDYSGNGGDESEKNDSVMHRESVEDGSAAVEGRAENGSVTHGEGDFSAVTLENVSDGGSGEKALKTAPEAASVEKTQVSEAEARAMLIEDNARAKEDLKKASSRGKKVLVFVIILAVMLIVAGVAVSVIVGGMNKDSVGNDDKQEGSGGGNSAVVEKPSEKPEELVELSLDDELVQRIYGNFQGIARLFDGWWGFYTDSSVRSGDVSREGMLLLAGANYPEGICVGDYEYGNGGKVTNECVSGETIRQKVAEMFGKEIELAEGDKLGSFCAGKLYVVENDEFYQAGNGCGGASSMRLVRVLEKAEEKGDEVYIYEK